MQKTALITGASSGIGFELAKVFARNGHDLVLVARTAEKLESLARAVEGEYKVTVLVLPKDLSRSDAAREIFEDVRSRGIFVEYLVNNAGFGDFGLFSQTEWKKEEQMINLNVISLTHFNKLFVKEMIAQKKGKILNLASTAAFQPGPLMAVYYATKAYVLSFSEALANELKGTGVTVTALCPGPTKSGFQRAAELEESKLVKGRKLPSSAQVAEHGYRAMMKGKTVAIHGVVNWFMAQSVRFAPRAMVTQMVRVMSEKSS
jgi:uncharacterized protein